MSEARSVPHLYFAPLRVRPDTRSERWKGAEARIAAEGASEADLKICAEEQTKWDLANPEHAQGSFLQLLEAFGYQEWSVGWEDGRRQADSLGWEAGLFLRRSETFPSLSEMKARAEAARQELHAREKRLRFLAAGWHRLTKRKHAVLECQRREILQLEEILDGLSARKDPRRAE